MKKGKQINWQTLSEIACYIAFALLMIYLIRSGKYGMYVTKRMIPYFYFTVAVLLLWMLDSLRRLFRPSYKNKLAHVLVLMAPILFFLLPHGLITESNFSIGESQEIFEQMSAKSPLLSGVMSMELSGVDKESKQIVISDENFGPWYTELTFNGKAYDGYEIEVKGEMLRSEEFMKDGEFLIARLLMTCCVADVAPGGLFCKYPDLSAFEKHKWYKVRGILEVESMMGYDFAKIRVESFEEARPVEGYAYP